MAALATLSARVATYCLLCWPSSVCCMAEWNSRRLERFRSVVRELLHILRAASRQRLSAPFLAVCPPNKYLINAEIRRRCDNQPPISVVIQKRRLIWFGHVSRMDPTRLPYRVLWRSQPVDWKVARSAPRKRWLNLIEKDLAQVGKSPHLVKRMAMDRTRYRTLIEEITRSTLDRFDG